MDNAKTIQKKLLTEDQLETISEDMANDSKMPSDQFVERYSFLDNYVGVQSVDGGAKQLFDFLKSTLEAERSQLPRKQELTESRQVVRFFASDSIEIKSPEPKKELLDSLEQAEIQSEDHRIQSAVEKAEFESDKRKLIEKKVKIENDYSPTVSLDDYKKQHSAIQFMRFGNEELQGLVMECRDVYQTGLEEKQQRISYRIQLSEQLEESTRATCESNGLPYEKPLSASEWLLKTKKDKIADLKDYIAEKEGLRNALTRIAKDIAIGCSKATEEQKAIAEDVMEEYQKIMKKGNERGARSYLTEQVIKADGEAKRSKKEMEDLVKECEELEKEEDEIDTDDQVVDSIELDNEQNNRKRSHEEIDGRSISNAEKKAQTLNADEAIHILGVKKSEIGALETYIEGMRNDLKNIDLSEVKQDKLVMETELETFFNPIKDGVEVCTMLKTKSQAKPMEWDHGHIPMEDLVIDDLDSRSSYENEEALLSIELEEMKEQYALAKQQYSDLMTRHTNALNEVDKVREGISIVKIKYRKEREEAQNKYEALGRRIQFYAEGIERLGGSFQEESIKAGVYEEKIETMEYDLDQYENEIKTLNFEVQQYIAENEELNGEIEKLEDDLEKQSENYTDLMETNKTLWGVIDDIETKLQHEKAMNNGIVAELDFMRKQEEKMTALLNTQEETIKEYKAMAETTEELLDKTEMLKTQVEAQLTVSNNAISELLANKGEVGEVMEKMFEHKNAEIADLQFDNNDLVSLLEENKDTIAELERKEKSLENILQAVDKMLLMQSDTILIGVETNKKLLKNSEEMEYDLGRAVDKLDKEQDTRIQLEERIKILEDCQRGLEEQLESVEDALEESGERYFNTVRIKAIECDDQAISDLGLYNEMLLERIQELEKQVSMRGDIPEDKEGAIKHLNNLKNELSVLTEKMLNTQIKISQIEKQEDMECGLDQEDGLSYRGSRIVQVDNVVLHTCIDNRHISEELDTHLHGVVGAVTTLVDIAGKSGAKGMASMILELDVPDSNVPLMQ